MGGFGSITTRTQLHSIVKIALGWFREMHNLRELLRKFFPQDSEFDRAATGALAEPTLIISPTRRALFSHLEENKISISFCLNEVTLSVCLGLRMRSGVVRINCLPEHSVAGKPELQIPLSEPPRQEQAVDMSSWWRFTFFDRK